MGKLTSDWFHAFQASFETDDDITEFIFERINTKDFEDSYVNVGGHSGEPNECIKYTAEEKRETVSDYLTYIVERKDKLEDYLHRLTSKRGVMYSETSAPFCPVCKSGEYMYNEDGNENDYCGQCGTKLDWDNMINEDEEE